MSVKQTLDSIQQLISGALLLPMNATSGHFYRFDVIWCILYLLTGYEGNSKSIDPEIPTIARGEAEVNSWYQGVNRLTIPRIHSQ